MKWYNNEQFGNNRADNQGCGWQSKSATMVTQSTPSRKEGGMKLNTTGCKKGMGG